MTAPDPELEIDITELESRIVEKLNKAKDFEKQNWARSMGFNTDDRLWHFDLSTEMYKYAAKASEYFIGKNGYEDFRDKVQKWPDFLWQRNFLSVWINNFDKTKAKITN